MKSYNKFLFLICFMSIAFAGVAFGETGVPAGQKTKFTKHFRETYFAITEKAEFSIEVLPDEKEYRIGKNVIGIVVHDKRDQDVEGAEINITDDKSRKFPVKDKGDGLYTVSDLDIKREGHWKLVIRINKKSLSDEAVFVFPPVSKKFLPPGSYDPEGLK